MSLAKAFFMKLNLMTNRTEQNSCHVNINDLPYSDMYFNTDLQFKMFKRGKPMDMILVKCIFQNRFT